MESKLPPLSSLRAFESSARLLSFKMAAAELLVSPSAVSHSVQNLEAWLGVELFRRMPRGIAITEAGQAYAEVIREALNKIARETSAIRKFSNHKQLILTVAPTFAKRWLLPRLPAFLQKYPGTSVVINTEHKKIDLSKAGADIAIRMGNGIWPNLSPELLMREKLVAVCSPELADKIDLANDIKRMPLIHVTNVDDDWGTYARGVGMPSPDPSRGLQFDNLQMAYQAAAEGLGIAVGRLPLIDQELGSGELVLAWPKAVSCRTGYWLVCAPQRISDPIVQAFRSWILQETRAAVLKQDELHCA